jgi:hypothetical protein
MKTHNIITLALGAVVGSIIASIIPSLLGGLFLMIAWNAIAWECNLPQFGYWVCVAVFYVPYAFISATRKTSEKDS